MDNQPSPSPAYNQSPVAPSPPAQPRPAFSNLPAAAAAAKKKRVFLLAFLIIYVIVFCLGLFGVYSAQQSKLDAANKAKAGVQSQLDQLKGKAAAAIDTSKIQSVFLNGGQVYFGKLTAIDDKNYQLTDIYYLRTNQAVQPDNSTKANQDISLVKLGCELHGPDDKMVIERSQVIFWENLKTDGQVAKAVAQYKQQNPNGQKCS